MTNRKEENLKELLERFVGTEQAQKAAENISQGEQILRDNSAPKPSKKLITEIKSEIGAELLRSRTIKTSGFRKTAYKIAVVAAAVIILAALSIKFFEKGDKPNKTGKFEYASIIPTSLWESDDIAADDMDLAILNAEIEQIEGEMIALQSSESGGNGQRAVTELEMELIEIDSDFWKG